MTSPEWSPHTSGTSSFTRSAPMEGAQYEPAMHPSPSEQAFAFAFAVDHYADQPPPGSPITSVAARPSSSFHPSSSPTPLHSFACVDLSKRWHPPFNTSPFSNASFVLHISPYAFLYINNNFSELASQQHEVIFIFNQLDSTATSFKTKI